MLSAIERCRTAALGGHRDRCLTCGYETASYSFNSCRNRHCPKCQTNAREKWLAKRSADLLPVPYVHVVFTLPHLLVPLAYHNKKLLYDVLFRASAETLLEVAANPKRLGAELGFLSVLHSWGQTLQHHPHVHCVIPAGGLSPDRERWIPARRDFFLPVPVLRKVFRGKFTDWAETPLARKTAVFARCPQSTETGENLSKLSAILASQEVGGVRGASLRRTRTRVAVSGSLHASCGDFQPPHRQLRRGKGFVPLEKITRTRVSSAS